MCEVVISKALRERAMGKIEDPDQVKSELIENVLEELVQPEGLDLRRSQDARLGEYLQQNCDLELFYFERDGCLRARLMPKALTEDLETVLGLDVDTEEGTAKVIKVLEDQNRTPANLAGVGFVIDTSQSPPVAMTLMEGVVLADANFLSFGEFVKAICSELKIEPPDLAPLFECLSQLKQKIKEGASGS
ncbi:MAG: hypothetical protein NTZ65_04830 [Candidatus Berkelbacteria bacterium]|nr:hypothetical protein [Candidatus Berkelbacteria bacterium]